MTAVCQSVNPPAWPNLPRRLHASAMWSICVRAGRRVWPYGGRIRAIYCAKPRVDFTFSGVWSSWILFGCVFSGKIPACHQVSPGTRTPGRVRRHDNPNQGSLARPCRRRMPTGRWCGRSVPAPSPWRMPSTLMPRSQMACQRSRSRGVGARISRRCKSLASTFHFD